MIQAPTFLSVAIFVATAFSGLVPSSVASAQTVSVGTVSVSEGCASASRAIGLLAQGTQGASVEPTASERAARGINFLTLLTQGGWFMFPLLLLSIVVVTITIERYLALRRGNVFPSEFVDELALLSENPGGLTPRRVYQACQNYPSSASYVMRSCLVKVGRPQIELEKAVQEASQREATRLAQTTSWLTLAAAVAPLIGLLGTVWGITQAFYDTTQLAELSGGTQNRGMALASGIYVALVTTMVGLMIAIPAAVVSHFYENRIVQLMNEIEEMIFNLLPQFERYEGKVRFGENLQETSVNEMAPVPPVTKTTVTGNQKNTSPDLEVKPPEIQRIKNINKQTKLGNETGGFPEPSSGAQS